MIFYRYFILTIFISFSMAIEASNPVFSKPDIASLVGSNQITSIYKDYSGILWIGTHGALFRFDGTKVTRYDAKKNDHTRIPTSLITDIAQSPDGRLFVATSGGGLLEWSIDRSRFLPLSKSNNNSSHELYLKSVLPTNDGRIWLLSSKSVFLHNPKTDKDFKLDQIARNSAYLRSPLSISKNANGDVLVSTRNGFFAIEPDTVSIKQIGLGTPQNGKIPGIYSIHLAKDGYLYVGTDQGHVIAYDPVSYQEISRVLLPNAKESLISDITAIDDSLIIATDIGIFSSDLQLGRVKNISLVGHGLSHNDVTALTRDNKGVWVGTYQGLEFLSFSSFELLNMATSRIPHDVTTFAEDQYGTMWVGTYNGLFYLNDSSDQHILLGSLPEHPVVVDQRISDLEISGNSLFVSYFSGGIQIFDLSNSRYREKKLDMIDNSLVTSMHRQRDPDTLWITSYDRGVAKIDSQDLSRGNAHWYLSGNSVLTLFETVDGSILAPIANRLYKYIESSDSFELIGIVQHPNEHVSVEIYSISQSENGDILVGTRDYGLYKLSEKNPIRPTSFTPLGEDSTLSSTIYAIEIDDLGNIWYSTSTGLVKLNPEGDFIGKFTTVDGLQSNDFERNSSFKSSNGELYFGGPNGYNRFQPEDVLLDRTRPTLTLTDIEFPEQDRTYIGDYSRAAVVILSHEDKVVTFTFSILDYSAPSENRFKYKMEGFDNNWIDNGSDNSATYTNLPSGEYTLRIQGANPSGIWNREGLSIKVIKSPPPWLSWWAFLFYLGALFAVWWASVKVYQSYTFRRKTEELQQEKLALEIRSHEDMQEQMEIQTQLVRSAYQHNSSTLSVLNTLLSHSEQQDTDSTNLRHLDVLTKLEKCLYYFADNPTANMKEFTNNILSELLVQASVDPNTIVTINEVTTKHVPTSVACALSIIIYELVENSLHHAFPPESPANYLFIGLRQKSGTEYGNYYWELSISDNGIGYSQDDSAGGTGLATVRRLVSDLDGEIDIDSGEGTSITIRITAETASVDTDPLALSA